MSLPSQIVGAVVFLFAAAAFLLADRYTPEAAMFPKSVAAVMMFCSVILIGRHYLQRNRRKPMPTEWTPFLRTCAAILLTAVYIVGVAHAGFVTASVVFVPAASWCFGYRCIGTVFVTTFIFIGAISFLFLKVFNVPLPPEFLGRLFQ